jgi:glutathione S-transferase
MTKNETPILFIGNKNYSSWSLRAWLAMRKSGVTFTEHQIILDTPTTAAEITAINPAGRVPALALAEGLIWDSLSIMEWADEQAQAAGRAPLWPNDPFARATARSAAAEMHSGFAALRNNFPMSLKRVRQPRRTPAGEAALSDVARIEVLWADLRARFGQSGPWLFGAWSLADAAFAPVAARLDSYAVDTMPETQAYIAAQFSDPDFQAWRQVGVLEPWVEGDIDTY